MATIPNYKYIFAIHRALLKRDIPDDLMPIFFEYIGNPTETFDDLINKWCFYQISYNSPRTSLITKKIRYERFSFGHYCSVCDKIYFIFTGSQFRNHIQSRIHQKCIKKYQHAIPILKNIEYLFKFKSRTYWKWNKQVKKKMLQSIQIQQAELSFV